MDWWGFGGALVGLCPVPYSLAWGLGFFDAHADLAWGEGSHLEHDLTNSRPQIHKGVVLRDVYLVNHLADQLKRRLSIHLYNDDDESS